MPIFNICCDVMTMVSSQIGARRETQATKKSASAFNSHYQAAATKISKNQQNQQISTPQCPWTTPDIQETTISSIKSASASSLQPPDSSTKSASASSPTTRQQHQNQHQLPASHQAAPLNQHRFKFQHREQHHISQPPARHPTNQLLTLLPCHTHTMAARSVVD